MDGASRVSASLSAPVPVEEAENGRAEKWSDIISVSHIPAEGGGEEEGGGRGQRRRRMSQNFWGYTANIPPPPAP